MPPEVTFKRVALVHRRATCPWAVGEMWVGALVEGFMTSLAFVVLDAQPIFLLIQPFA